MDSRLFDGKYKVCEKLGEGAFGEVFLAVHIDLNVYRAIKRIRKDHNGFQTGRNEVSVLKNLFHPGLPIIYDIWEDDIFFYIVEEYVRGRNLADYVASKKKISEREVIAFAISICAILQYMQENGGICHLDIKPDNIIVNDEKIKLLDFGSGFSKNKNYGPITATHGYAAPELYIGEDIDGRSDIYSVGRLMMFLLSKDICRLSDIKCSESLKSVISKCIKSDKASRYENAKALKEELILLSERRPTDKSVVIKVFGSMPRIGTSHFSVMLASFFYRKGYDTALFSDSVTPMINENVKKLTLREGVYFVDGLPVIPDYGGYASVDEDFYKKKILVRDCGLLTTEKIEEKCCEEEICLLVCGHTLLEILEYNKAVGKMQKFNKEFVTCVNHAGGREYLRIRRAHIDGSCLRIPYCVDPYGFGGSEAINEILYEVQKRQGSNRRGRLRGVFGGHTFVFLHSKLFGKCGRKENRYNKSIRRL